MYDLLTFNDIRFGNLFATRSFVSQSTVRLARSNAGQTSAGRQTACVYPGLRTNAAQLAGTMGSLRHRLVCFDKSRVDLLEIGPTGNSQWQPLGFRKSKRNGGALRSKCLREGGSRNRFGRRLLEANGVRLSRLPNDLRLCLRSLGDSSV